ncbi:hypothetical protein B0H14DRAFT_2684894 [Mycena olivaceomarginata]|nr:hypothetical protein B0H14DRAFT_2684894 [Mycena olivaceomarginata]
MLQICLLLPTPFPVDPHSNASPQEFSRLFAQPRSPKSRWGPSARIRQLTRSSGLPSSSGLSEQFLASFPSTDKVQWHVMHEKVKLAAASLDVIRRVSNRVEEVFMDPAIWHDAHLRGCSTSATLWRCGWMSSLSRWTDFRRRESWQMMRCRRPLLVLRSLGGAVVHIAESKEPLWKTLRVILSESLDVVTDLISRSSTLVFPVSVTLFTKTPVQDATVQDSSSPASEAEDKSFSLILESIGDLPTFLSTTLNILWFLTDLTRQIAETVSKAFAFCSSASCIASAEKRARFPTGWDCIDSEMQKIFQSPHFVPPSKADLMEILSLPQLRDRLVVCLCAAPLPHFQDDCAGPHLDKECAVLLRELEERLAKDEVPDWQRPGPTTPRPLVKWHEEIRESVQQIIYPITISWMDDDETMSEADHAQRAVDDVRPRFERLVETDGPSRIALLDKLVKFGCAVSGCKQPDLPHPSKRLKLSTLPAALICCRPLPRRPEVEVPPGVRRRAVRLGAGCSRRSDCRTRSAMAALICLYAAEGPDAWKYTQPLFSQLNEVLAGNKIPVKETLLVTVGWMGKTKKPRSAGPKRYAFLIAQIGSTNPVLRGTACMQSVMAVMLPYFDQIAPFLVLRMCTHPELLADPRPLLLNHSADILAHLFLLRGPGQTDKAMTTLLDVLMDSANQKGIDTQSVVKSSIVQLIAQLVIVMGDEDPDTANSAIPALRKVERVMVPEGDASSSDFTVAPQIMATFQTMIGIPELSEITLQSWHIFLSTPAPQDIGPHVGPTSAAFVSSWSTFSPAGRALATKSLEYLIIEIGSQLGAYLDEILDRAWSDNLTVAIQSLGELKNLMLRERKDFVSGLASGDMFDPLVGQILSALFAAACREGDGTDALRLLAFECIDRFEIGTNGPTMIMTSNFTNEDDSMTFADIRYQSQLAYCIQELLKFCKFTPALVATGNNTSVPMKVRNRTLWRPLQPLLEGRFAVPPYTTPQDLVHPIYPCHSTYREWIQWWSVHLITRASGQTAQMIFRVFRQAVRNKDVVVAHHLLPHLVLNILISGDETDAQNIRTELLTVLEDQVDAASPSSEDKKLLSAQWVRIVRQELTAKKHEHKRSRNAGTNQLEEQLMRVDSILSSINENLMAKAALKCKAYAQQSPQNNDLNAYYERLHEIYAHIDQPDGMEGVSTLILSPSLEHQIRQHESTGRWTSAQSCWEVRLQQSPDNLDFHLGLLRCLRNLGHYDTLRTHVRGVLTRNPEWQLALAGFQVESAWMVGAWEDVEDLAHRSTAQTSSIVIARVLLAMRSKDAASITSSLSAARSVLGTPITAAGAKGHRRLEIIYNALTSLPSGSQGHSQLRQRTAGQWQTRTVRCSRLSKAATLGSRSWRAQIKLENSMRALGLLQDRKDSIDLTGEDDDETKRMKAKALVLRARWMNDHLQHFLTATELQPDWESGHFHLGQFHDECFKKLPQAEQTRSVGCSGLKMNSSTVKSFSRAMKHGSKYVYQTVPRLLTIWLDLGEDRRSATQETFKRLNEVVAKAIKEAPVYKWFTAFPQIVSRVGHENDEVFKNLSKLIIRVLEEYPKQALWLFTSVVKSTKSNREQRGKKILEKLTNNPNSARTGVSKLVADCTSMTNQLLNMCDAHVTDEVKTISMQKNFPALFKLGRSDLIIPLQESLTPSLPPTSSLDSDHQPFPVNAPTFHEFFDEIEVMRSLAKPRKITIRGEQRANLHANSESRRRQLHIRTYGVVTLNEECGFIQWVPNTIPLRPVLMKGYEARRIKSWSSEMNEIFRRIKDASDTDAAQQFRLKILANFPPVFHDWFIETFPEPTAWLASRLAYGRTAAVMSMVGFILGAGSANRHCENILLDANTGDVVHVDFNCLFEKVRVVDVHISRYHFRLTQNIIDGLGVTGVEGVFRIACEVTMQLLRDNKDSLMSVLDAFIHDPLVEWEDEKRKLVLEMLTTPRRNVSPRGATRSSRPVDLRMLGKNALSPIERKLKGLYQRLAEKEVSTGNLVQMLIQEATDTANLAKMYPGWASWH